jgi:hypothetical protein
MTPSLAAAASGNLAAFEGSQIVGTVPIRESLLNEALREATANPRGRVKGIELRIGADNVLECGVRIAVGPFAKWFRPRFILTPRIVTSRGPVIVLTVASNEYMGLMWIAQVFATEYFPRGVTIDGRQIVVDLAAIPQMAQVRGVLRYLRTLTARTTPGLLFIDFDIKVDET